MKNIKKFGLLAIMSIAALGFFGCSDDAEEDEDLVVSIINDSENIVTITPPTEYADKETYIIYTNDGSDPTITVSYDETVTSAGTGYPAGWNFTFTGNLYTDPFTSSVGTTIKALAYYFNDTDKKCYKGSVTTYTVKAVEADTSSGANTTVSNDIPSTAVTFKLASTANSYTTKYFDTSSTNVFKYGDKNAYYQTQFSWKGTGKGNWYLYMREVGGQMIKNGTDTFIAKGTYTGSTFDNTSSATAINTGTTLKLLNEGSSTENEITVDAEKKFSLKVTGVNSSGSLSSGGVYVGDAK